MIQPAQSFKMCSTCKAAWSKRDDFLADSEIELIGYQQNYRDLEAGYFLFNHSCENTLAISVSEFVDLHDGPVFEESLDGTEECSGFCQREDNLEPCPRECECAFVRSIMQLLLHWPKKLHSGKRDSIKSTVSESDRSADRI